jgi:hypothetical protein
MAQPAADSPKNQCQSLAPIVPGATAEQESPSEGSTGSPQVRAQQTASSPGSSDDPANTDPAAHLDQGGANPRDDQADPAAPNAPAQERPCTRLSRGTRRPKVRTDGTIPYTCFANRVEPQSLEEALSNKNWKQAMDIEYDALVKNKSWHLVPPQKGRNVIDYKWVYKVKEKADGSLDRYKSMTCCKGF